MDQYYVVWSPSRTDPTKKHYTLSDAKREAGRLAHESPGEEYVVLQSLGSMKVESSKWTEHVEAEELPF